MTKQTFIENFEYYVKNQIRCDFEQNKYLHFTLDFRTLIENYLNTFIENTFYVSTLSKELEKILFDENFDLIQKLENFNSSFYQISRKFDTLIYEIDEQNFWCIETLNMIITKIQECKKTIS
jgi:hypothetical protein